jgi:hypothetical protein
MKIQRLISQTIYRIYIIVFILFLVVALCPQRLSAKPVTAQQARKVVKGFLNCCPNPLQTPVGSQTEKVDNFKNDYGQTLYYVVYLKPSGFIIAPADDLIEPIIAFVPDGTYDPSPTNPLGALVTNDLSNRIAAVQNNRQTINGPAKKAQEKWNILTQYADDQRTIQPLGTSSISDVRVAPLIQSTWDQEDVDGLTCYNYYTPENYPTGCVATAMAQFMRYHQHPTDGVGTLFFDIKVDGLTRSVSLRGGDGIGGPYSWVDMVLQPDGSMTPTQRQAIGALCYDAGVSVEMSYYLSSSSASLSDSDDQLVDVFDYSNSIFGYNNYNNIGSGLTNMINPNLDAQHPVLLGLTGPAGGHAVICDGYGYSLSTLYHHINMGWSGNDNAWYDLPIVDAYYYFDVVHTCLYNIFTDSSGEIISGRITDLDQNPIPDVLVTALIGSSPAMQTTTNQEGIYALKGLSSYQTYTIDPTKEAYEFTPQNITTGSSSDLQSTSGNRWAVDFTAQNATPPIAYDQATSTLSGQIKTITLEAVDEGYPNPPAQLTYIITALPGHGKLFDPLADEIISVPYTLLSNSNVVNYQSCGYFTGQDTFQFVANDGGTAPEGGDSNIGLITIDVDNYIYTTFEIYTNYIAHWPLYTSAHDARTQVIYLQSEIGGPKTITDLAIDIYNTPGQTLNNFTIRMKHTSQSYYSGYPLLETSGWTTVYQSNEPASPAGWRYFSFQTPFDYNGTSNLLIDFSFNNSYSTYDGDCHVSDTGATRVIIAYSDSDDGDPLDWTSYTLPIYTAYSVPNLKLISKITAEPTLGDFGYDCDVDIEDFSTLAFAWLSDPNDGNWNGRCDISDPNDSVIDGLDLEVFSQNWLWQ